MRYRKKEFKRRLDTLEQVNQCFRQGGIQERESVLKVLADCQIVALEMGTCLETLGETAADTIVHMLEDYCESLYQQSIYFEDAGACRQIAKKIRKQLGEISRMIRLDLPEGKREVVFLPYKASMWDSLESVWMAAREDESCEAVVVSVPYFDKNPDGSLGEMHDEKNQYPAYVPVTDWQEYSIAERRPDAIYIHNPYDNNNRVTSVHPAFYAEELKQYTEMLVYIPYFVSVNGYVPEHFCVLPGAIYADHVIVESDEVRKIYVDTFRRWQEENHCQGRFGDPEKKFLALGSPKFDRVRSIVRKEYEDIDIPPDWEAVIRKPDGTRKKILLYNTTIDSFLKHSEIVLEKIRQTLQMMKENPDVALLWRPHPLLLSTARSMRESLYPKLCRMVREYKEEGWGIYDDTADIERAIAVSDAYYGDWSSVVTLYQEAGKPVMIQDYGEDGKEK